MHLADILVIAAYLGMLIGIRSAGRLKITGSYFVASRSVPGWAAGVFAARHHHRGRLALPKRDALHPVQIGETP